MNHVLMFCSVLAVAVGWVSPPFAQAGEDTTTRPIVFTNASALLKQVQKAHRNDILRDESGNVVAVTLRDRSAIDSNLYLLNSIPTLQQLYLAPTQKGGLSMQGILALKRLTNLTSLNLSCTTGLSEGVFCGICDLKQLTRLELVAACPTYIEYSCITNLKRLVELRVTYCTNFDDAAFSYVTNLTKLKRLTIYADAVSNESTNLLRDMRELTNAVIRERVSPR